MRSEKVMEHLETINKVLCAALAIITTVTTILKTVDWIIDSRKERRLRELETKLELAGKY